MDRHAIPGKTEGSGGAFNSSAVVKTSPLYEVLSDTLKSLIERGDWIPGQLAPGEIEIARRFGVSIGTVRKAMELLQAQGVVARRQGHGTLILERGIKLFPKSHFVRSMWRGVDVYRVGREEILNLPSDDQSEVEHQTLLSGAHGPIRTFRRRVMVSERPAVVSHYLLCDQPLPNASEPHSASSLQQLLDRISGVVSVNEASLGLAPAPLHVADALGVQRGHRVLNTETQLMLPDGATIGIIRRWFVIEGFEIVLGRQN